MIYSVHTYVSRRQHGNGSGGEAWAGRPTLGLGVNTGQTHRGGGGGGGDGGGSLGHKGWSQHDHSM